MHNTLPKSRGRLPSLDLLKGFEAAARHLSFTKAAEELFLTQSALSRQMQTLEEQLGLPLFERRHRQLLLTDAGQVLHATAKNVLEEIAQAVTAIRRDQASQPLTVSTNQPFASLWLIPRLARFRERHPNVDVYISADNRIVDLEREHIDLAVRYCGEASVPDDSIKLFGERIMPVCSPGLAADRTRPLRRPEDLAHHVLLAIDDERGRFPWLNWSAWLAAFGIGRLTPGGSLKFNHFDQVIQAAIDGQGVALGREPLIDRLIRQRKLVAPFPDRYATPRAYYIVRAPHAALRPEAQAFSDWLQEEARADAVESENAAPARAPKRSRSAA